MFNQEIPSNYPDNDRNSGVSAERSGDFREERSKRNGERDNTMCVEELTARLNYATKGRNTR